MFGLKGQEQIDGSDFFFFWLRDDRVIHQTTSLAPCDISSSNVIAFLFFSSLLSLTPWLSIELCL